MTGRLAPRSAAVPATALTRSVGCSDQARPRRHRLLLSTPAVGDVAHVGGEGRFPGQASAGDGHLGRELSAVGTTIPVRLTGLCGHRAGSVTEGRVALMNLVGLPNAGSGTIQRRWLRP